MLSLNNRPTILLAVLFIGGMTLAFRLSDMETAKSEIRAKFPAARQLQTEELAAWLENPSRMPPLIIDARSREEFSVSSLPHARHAEKISDLRDVDKNRAIVVYCSVGYRSSALVEKLMKQGFTEVYNLEGSIFEWANEGRPLVKGGKAVEEVHPFDKKWSRLLEKKYHAKGQTQ